MASGKEDFVDYSLFDHEDDEDDDFLAEAASAVEASLAAQANTQSQDSSGRSFVVEDDHALPTTWSTQMSQAQAQSLPISGPSADHLAKLKSTFGHNEFRPSQWRIIRNVLVDRRDQCIVMATGYGKSLCYQYPAVYSNGLTVVVSPLISLMEDQVFGLEQVRDCLLSGCLLRR
jgi:superfamily II DNA helicase RecQ